MDGAHRPAADRRAQTTIDFAIAMGVFLVALTTVVVFMPTMTQPFMGGQQNPLLADRLAAQLTDGQLGGPSEPSELNATCTMHFFNETTPDPCSSFVADDDVTAKLGVDDDVFVNVTIQQNVTGDAGPEVVCEDGNEGVEACPGSGDRMAVGPEPPNEAGSITIARRFALLGDEQVYVVVRVWS